MKELYISPLAEILYFMPTENIADNSIDWYNGIVSDSDDPADKVISGTLVPGWGT